MVVLLPAPSPTVGLAQAADLDSRVHKMVDASV
jgi:hypothetical protein